MSSWITTTMWRMQLCQQISQMTQVRDNNNNHTNKKKWQVVFLTKSTWCARLTYTKTYTWTHIQRKHANRSASFGSPYKCTISIHIDMAISQVFAQTSRIVVIEPIEIKKRGFEEKNKTDGNGSSSSSRSRDNENNNKCLCFSIE